MPAPTTAWGRIVQATDAVGMNASAAAPAATSSAPATARVPAGPPIRAAASALSGITLTTTAAASGSMLQPLMSMSTVRKSAAAMAPETSASAASWSGAAGREARRRGAAGAGSREACRHRGERGGNLNEEDRPPAEPLCERSADGRARGHAEERRLAPQREGLSGCPPRSPTRIAWAVTSSAAPPSACTRAGHEQQLDPLGQAAHQRPDAEQRHSGQAERADAPQPAEPLGRQQRGAQHHRVYAQHGRHPRHTGVELGEDGRQGERDDRRVGQGQKGDARQWETCRPAGGRDRHAHDSGWEAAPRMVRLATPSIRGSAILLV